METIVEKFILQLEAQLAERRVVIALEPEARAWLAREGLRPGLRRAAARARHPDRGPRSADRRDPVRPAGERRHGHDPAGRGRAGVRLRGGAETARAGGRITSGRRARHPGEGRRPALVGEQRRGAGDREARAARRSSRPTSRSSNDRSPTRIGWSRSTSASTGRRRASSRRRGCGCGVEIAKDVERARRDVLAELLEVVDNLDRAVDAAGPTASLESVVQGIEMVRRQFIAKLEGLGVTRVDADRPAVRSAGPRGRDYGPGRLPRGGRHGDGRHPPRLPHRRRRAPAGVGGGRKALRAPGFAFSFSFSVQGSRVSSSCRRIRRHRRRSLQTVAVKRPPAGFRRPRTPGWIASSQASHPRSSGTPAFRVAVTNASNSRPQS